MSLSQCPAAWRDIAREQHNLSTKWFAHSSPLRRSVENRLVVNLVVACTDRYLDPRQKHRIGGELVVCELRHCIANDRNRFALDASKEQCEWFPHVIGPRPRPATRHLAVC